MYSLCQKTREVRTPKQNLKAQGDRRTSLAADMESIGGRGLAAQSGCTFLEPNLAEVGKEQGGGKQGAEDLSQARNQREGGTNWSGARVWPQPHSTSTWDSWTMARPTHLPGSGRSSQDPVESPKKS